MDLRWIPNAISCARIALVAPVVISLVEQHYAAALLLFAFAGGSDGVDGFLAKRYGWQTRIGGLLDPVADKTLVGATFVQQALVLDSGAGNALGATTSNGVRAVIGTR